MAVDQHLLQYNFVSYVLIHSNKSCVIQTWKTPKGVYQNPYGVRSVWHSVHSAGDPAAEGKSLLNAYIYPVCAPNK